MGPVWARGPLPLRRSHTYEASPGPSSCHHHHTPPLFHPYCFSSLLYTVHIPVSFHLLHIQSPLLNSIFLWSTAPSPYHTVPFIPSVFLTPWVPSLSCLLCIHTAGATLLIASTHTHSYLSSPFLLFLLVFISSLLFAFAYVLLFSFTSNFGLFHSSSFFRHKPQIPILWNNYCLVSLPFHYLPYSFLLFFISLLTFAFISLHFHSGLIFHSSSLFPLPTNRHFQHLELCLADR